MKSIPYEIKTRLLHNIQASATDADPKLKVIATQSTTNTLLSEIIHNNIDPEQGDVAIRQLQGEADPSLAYAVCIDDGTANIYERLFPAYIEKPWEYAWTLDTATDVAIEFNGVWKISPDGQYYNLATDTTPYIFYVKNETLYVQKWDDETTRTTLAEGVSKISACRGWQSSDIQTLDQGLIISYLKNGSVFYRAFCFQEDETYLWETEREVTDLGSGNVTISAFRTNDFRVGFICEKTAGGFAYVLSERTYAGQSVQNEYVFCQIANCTLSALPITKKSVSSTENGFINTIVPNADIYIGCCMTFPEFSVVSTERIGKTNFVIETSHQLQKRKDLEYYFEFDVMEDGAKCSEVTVSENKIYITSNMDISTGQNVTITLKDYSRLCFLSENASPLAVPEFTATFKTDPPTDDHPEMSVSFAVNTLEIHAIQYIENQTDEQTAVTASFACTLEAIQVGNVPV